MNVLRTIASLLLALLVLVSSTSFMVGMHICMGDVQNVAVFTKADVCEREQSLPPCHRHQTAPCCEDETLIHEGQDVKASMPKAQLNAPVAIDVEQAVVLISEVVPSAPAAKAQYYNYDPPLRSSDLTVEHRVFLI